MAAGVLIPNFIADSDTPSPDNCTSLRVMLLSDTCPPLVITGGIVSWPARSWTLDSLVGVLEDRSFRCRLMPREKEFAAFESDGVYVSCTLRQFSAWSRGNGTADDQDDDSDSGDDSADDNPLCPFSPDRFSAYIDYKYMAQVFEGCSEMLTEVQWSTLGLNGIDGANSTIWIGSTGASTPCHYDSYGFNLVAQIQGKKQWVLFPPTDTKCLYPTRIPYEESSVFSQVDVTRPNLHRFPLFQKSRPYVVTLEPGQVLFVPRHWWHFVTCTETAISINTWVDIPKDAESRVHEAVTRNLASAFFPYLTETVGTSGLEQWINPTEDIEPATTNVAYLGQVFGQLTGCKNLSAVRSVCDQGDSEVSHSGSESPTPDRKRALDSPEKTDETRQRKRQRESLCMQPPTLSTTGQTPSSDLKEEDLKPLLHAAAGALDSTGDCMHKGVKQQGNYDRQHSKTGDSESCNRVLQLAEGLKDFEVHFVKSSPSSLSDCSKDALTPFYTQPAVLSVVPVAACTGGSAKTRAQQGVLTAEQDGACESVPTAVNVGALSFKNGCDISLSSSSGNSPTLASATTLTNVCDTSSVNTSTTPLDFSNVATVKGTSESTPVKGTSKCDKEKVYMLQPLEFSEFLQMIGGSEEEDVTNREAVPIQDVFLRSLLDPEVVQMIVEKMQEQLNNS